MSLEQEGHVPRAQDRLKVRRSQLGTQVAKPSVCPRALGLLPAGASPEANDSE